MSKKLISVSFEFEHGKVVWDYRGKGTINGREYSHTYSVDIYPYNGNKDRSYQTSKQANKTNSLQYLKDV